MLSIEDDSHHSLNECILDNNDDNNSRNFDKKEKEGMVGIVADDLDDDMDDAADRAFENAESYFHDEQLHDEDTDEETGVMTSSLKSSNKNNNPRNLSDFQLLVQGVRQCPRTSCTVFVVLVCITVWLGSTLNSQPTSGSTMVTSTAADGVATTTIITDPFLITQAKNRSDDFSTILDEIESSSYMNLARKHPALSSSDDGSSNVIAAKYKPHLDWQQYHLPDISIVGLPHAFTTTAAAAMNNNPLYSLLMSHPKVSAFHSESSEFCFNLGPKDLNVILDSVDDSYSSDVDTIETTQQVLFHANHVGTSNREQPIERQWGHVDHARDINDGIQTVNACTDPRLVLIQRQYLHPEELQNSQQRHKFIVIFRDPAQWLWNGYNELRFGDEEDYYYDHSINGHDDSNDNDIDNNGIQYIYRSQSLFHELMQSGGRLRTAHDLIESMRDEIGLRQVELLLKSGIPTDQILAIRFEDLLSADNEDVINRLSDFLNLNKEGFDVSSSFSVLPTEQQQQVLLDESTRDLVYLQMINECQLWADQFDIVYDDCLAIRNKYLA
jgi:hypothetical protein